MTVSAGNRTWDGALYGEKEGVAKGFVKGRSEGFLTRKASGRAFRKRGSVQRALNGAF